MERRTVRQRKVSSRVDTVTASERRSAATARLEALETDHDAGPTLQDSDDEFVLEESDEGEQQCVTVNTAVDEELSCAVQTSCSLVRAAENGRERLREVEKQEACLPMSKRVPKALQCCLRR